MVTGRDLIQNGWPEGPTIGLALAAARKLSHAGMNAGGGPRRKKKQK